MPIFLLLLLLSHPLFANMNVTGRLLEKGTKTPLASVSVFLLPHKLKVETNEKGEFVFENPPLGPAQFVVNLSGYKRLDEDVVIEETPKSITLYVEKASYQVFETTIYGREKKRDDVTRTLKAKTAAETPGAFGDPIRAVQNLPGVARTGGSQVVIQGGSPQDTSYTIDEHRVPLIFHFGGLSSVVFPEAADRIDYLSAGYGAEFGRALSGYINVYTKSPRKDRWGALGFVDLINVGALGEGPIGEKSSLLTSIRYSYVGEVIKAATAQMGDSAARITAAPVFTDLTLVYEHEPNDNNVFKITGIASRDAAELILKEPLENNPSIRGSFENETLFYRIIPQWRHKINESQNIKFSFAIGRDQIRTDADEIYFRVTTDNLSIRGESEWKKAEWTHYLGFDNYYTWFNVESKIAVPYSSGGVANPLAGNELRATTVKGKSVEAALYSRHEWKIGRWTHMPQLRAEYFKTTRELLPSPRLATRYSMNDTFFIRGATGLYYQPPQPPESDSTFGNPDIKAPRAIHATFGLNKDFREGKNRGFKTDFGIFWKELDRLVIRSPDTVERDGARKAEVYNNKGKGRVYGFETQINYDTQPWNIVLSYTLSRSLRWNQYEGTLLSQFDQTHNVNFMTTLTLDNWKFGTRTRYVTGNPTTPVIGSYYDSDNDSFIPERGPLYSQRNDPFFQIDLRVDRKFVRKEWILSAYLDVQNLTNNQNAQGFLYSYDYSKKEAITGLGIFPSIGVKGEY